EAKKIAKAAVRRGTMPGQATARDVRHLARLASSLLRLSLEAFDYLDYDKASEVITRDHDLDTEYSAGLRRLITRAMEDPRNFDVTIEAAFVLKSFERIGDHARNVARHLQSMGRGEVEPRSQPAV